MAMQTAIERSAIPTRFAFCYHPDASPPTINLVEEIIQSLRENGIPILFSAPLYDPQLNERVEHGDFDILVAVGGDGTMLRAGHLSAPVGLPILGINTGGFGFLTEVKDGEWRQAFQTLLAGDYRIETRMMLQVEHWRGSELQGSWSALNEVVVARGWDVRPISLEASVDGYTVASFIADGLIVSTATGSTAYALAAGGPIMPPDLHNILIIPIAPHLSVDRAVILSQGASMRLTAATRHQAVFSIDGQRPVVLAPQDHVQVFAAENMVSFIRFKDPGYFYHNLMMYMERNPSVGKALS